MPPSGNEFVLQTVKSVPSAKTNQSYSRVSSQLHFSGGKARRRRYDPNEDPNFNVHSPEFNNELRKSIHTANYGSPPPMRSMKVIKKASLSPERGSDGNMTVSDTEEDNLNRRVSSGLQKNHFPAANKRHPKHTAQSKIK